MSCEDGATTLEIVVTIAIGILCLSAIGSSVEFLLREIGLFEKRSRATEPGITFGECKYELVGTYKFISCIDSKGDPHHFLQ